MSGSSVKPLSTTALTLSYGLPVFAYMYVVGSVGFWLPLYVRLHGYSYMEVQLVSTVYYLVVTPSTLVAGNLGDRSEKPNRIVAWGLFINAAMTLLMAYESRTAPLLGARALQALGLSASFPIALGAMSLQLGVSRGVTLNSLMNAAGMAAGSIIGGVLIDVAGFEGMFYSAAAVSVVAGLVALDTEFPSIKSESRLLESLRRMPWSVRVALLGLFLRNIFASGVFAVQAILFNQTLGLSLLETAVALALNPIMQAIASLYVADKVAGRELLYYSLGLASTSIVFYMYLYAYSVMVAVAAQLLLGFVFAVINVAGNVYIISRMPEKERYTASGLFNFSFNMGWIIGTLAAGALMSVYGVFAWIIAAVVLTPAVGIVTYACGRRAEGREEVSRVDSQLSRLS